MNGRSLCICYGSLDVLEGIMGLVVAGDFATEIKCHLANGNKKLNMKKAEMLQSSLNYGKWLTLAYRKFQSDGKLDDEWARWLFIYTGISESYAQQLQELSEKFYKHPRFHYRNCGK